MKLYVVRHGHAGSRSSWDGPDDHRPLTAKGRRQAAAIADTLAATKVSRLVSSPSLRCTQTLEPLGDALGLAVSEDVRLLEGAEADDALDLVRELRDAGRTAAVCSHGDVIPDMLRALQAHGTRFAHPLVWPKGSTWVLTWNGDRWSRARYIAPPAI